MRALLAAIGAGVFLAAAKQLLQRYLSRDFSENSSHGTARLHLKHHW
jgi:hypothetical protein